MRVVIVSGQRLLQSLLPFLNKELDIAAVVFTDIGELIQGSAVLTITETKVPVYSFAYMEECLEQFYYDFVVINLPRWSSDTSIVQDELIRQGIPKEKLLPLGGFYTELFHGLGHFFRYIAPKASDYKVFITGDSRIWRGTDLSCYALPAVNCALPGQDLYYDCLWFDKFMDIPYVAPRYAILGLSPWQFHYDVSLGGTEQWLLPLYYMLFQDVHHFHVDLHAMEAIFSPQILEITQTDPPKDFDLDKFSGRYALQEMTLVHHMKARSEAGIWDRKRYPETVIENKRLFLEFLRKCNRHSVVPIVAIMPFTATYKTFLPQRLMDEFYYIIHESKKEEDFQFLDMSAFEAMKTEDFLDAAHPNASGGKKFPIS